MKWGRIVLVIFGALIITALGIDAADTISGKDGTLLSQVISSQKGACPKGMVEVAAVPGITCVDMYEASASKECPHESPKSFIETQKNVESRDCTAVSLPSHTPWSFVAREHALQLCARSGKRLPTAAEWYGLSLGMTEVESSCNVQSGRVALTGAHGECLTPFGAYDLIGNVWEWVSDDVIDGTFNNRELPPNGYVEQVDSAGVAVRTREIEQDMYGKDYFWTAGEGLFGMVRGGYYDSGTDAGVYAVHADTPTQAASVGIGFRCVK